VIQFGIDLAYSAPVQDIGRPERDQVPEHGFAAAFPGNCTLCRVQTRIRASCIMARSGFTGGAPVPYCK
jgi:hypothetical protein